MAGLFDPSMFDPQSYQGISGLLGNLFNNPLGANQLPPSAGFPDQVQNGPTYANGTSGMMGGVPFPIAPADPGATTLSAQTQQPQAPQSSPLGGLGNMLSGIFSPQQTQAPSVAPTGSPLAPNGSSSPSIMDRISAISHNIGGGGGLISSLIDGGAGQRTDPKGIAMAQLNATYQSLVKSGVPEPTARAAALNPELLKTIAPEYFGGYKVVQTGESPLGKQFAVQGPGGKFYPIGGDSGPGSVAGGGSASGVGTMNLLAPGVKQFNASLSGDDYLNQFGPEVKAAVKAYMNGDVLPSGNPRSQGIATLAKTVAQKYGQDMGIPVSDATY